MLSGAQRQRDDNLDTMVKTVDALFGSLAEKAVIREKVSFEEALEEAWALYERGHIKLVSEPGRDTLGIEFCMGRSERRAAAVQNRRLASYRRRMAM
jgi:hypothetical protein